MHALLARRAGHSVVQIERDAAARSASVRNFGLVWVSGRAGGEELAVALRARELWQTIGDLVPGVGFRAEGSLTIALTAEEAKVMEAFAGSPEAPPRSIVFVDASELRARNPAVHGEVHGGLWCDRDAIVEPRHVVAAVREWLAAQGQYRWLGGRSVDSWETGSVVDHLGERHTGDAVIVCTGADRIDLPDTGLRRVRLQMMQTAPHDERLSTSIADADSLRYYPAYASASLIDLGRQDPVAEEHHMQLLLVQRAGGELTIGDTHEYDEPFDFALDETPYDYLRERASRILGRPLPPVVRRWDGVYSQRIDGGLCTRLEVAPGVWFVTGLGGRGMTCSPAVAEQTLQQAGLL
jgi:FAD dependent oxidoreductase TIGR03364